MQQLAVLRFETILGAHSPGPRLGQVFFFPSEGPSPASTGQLRDRLGQIRKPLAHPAKVRVRNHLVSQLLKSRPEPPPVAIARSADRAAIARSDGLTPGNWSS